MTPHLNKTVSGTIQAGLPYPRSPAFRGLFEKIKKGFFMLILA
jgi:hypothetical protein